MAKRRKASAGGTSRKRPAKSARRAAGGKSVRKASRKPGAAGKARKAPGKAGKAAGKARAPAVKTSKPGRAAKKPAHPKKTHLSRKDLEEFRDILLQKRHELLGDLTGMEMEATRQHGSGNLSRMPTHMADVGTDNFEHEFTLGLLESEQQLLREIDEALKRIDEKTYGVCMGTGERIPKTRLRAKPWAKYTVEYTRLLEKGLVSPSEGLEEQDQTTEEDANAGGKQASGKPENRQNDEEGQE